MQALKPKMIIFDVGRTLLTYTDMDTLKGVRALMPYITDNPHNLSAEEIDQRTNDIFSLFDESRKQLFEVPEKTILTLVYDTLGLKFSISIEEVERIIWSEDTVKVPIPHTKELLDRLHEMGIQTAVISNIDFSGDLLRQTLNQTFPNNHFQFVIASSDYGVRKPNHYIFEAGLTRSNLLPSDIWYVGDKVQVDVEGSRAVGMTPVLYKFEKNTYEELLEDLIVIDDLLDLLKYM